MSYVIVSVVSLMIGCTIGVFTLALCMVSKSIEGQEKENDCYGVSFGDCDRCPKNGSKKNES